MNDIMKIVQALEDSNILLKGVTKTIEDETKKQKDGFLSMSLGTLGTSLLGNLLTGKGIARAGYGNHLKNKMHFSYSLILKETFKYKSIMKMNQDSMEFFQEIVYM